MHSLYRDSRDMCVTCAGQCCRDRRDTPLGGVTIVTLARSKPILVPMPPKTFAGRVAVRDTEATHTGGGAA